MDYENEFQVILDDGTNTHVMEVSYKGSSYFKFKVPADLSVGTYDLKIAHNGVAKDTGYDYECITKPLPTYPSSTSLKTSSVTVGSTVQAYVKNMDYGDGFIVYLENSAGTRYAVKQGYEGKSYFKFDVISTTPARTYKIITQHTVDGTVIENANEAVSLNVK